MDLTVFERFHSMSIIIIIEAQIGPSVASWTLFKLAPESFLYNPSSFT